MGSALIIQKSEVITDQGQIVQVEYDEEGDILELFFERGPANCAVELSDNIILRFDHAWGKPLSLSLLSYSHIVQPTEVGPRSFPLTGLDNLPDDLRQTVVKIITSPPVNQFLKVSSFYPSPTRRIALTYVEKSDALVTV